MSAPKSTDPQTRKILKFGIRAVVLAGIAFLLSSWASSAGLPEPAGVAFVILVVAAGLWITEAVPLFVTSFLILLLSIIWLVPVMNQQGDTIAKDAFLAPFFSDIILLFLGGFVLSAALHKFRLDEQMARWIIRKSGGSLPRLMLGVMAITAFLSMWLSNTATAAMMLALVLPIVNGLPEGSPKRKGLILAIPFAANAGGLGTPIGSPPNAIAINYMRSLDIAPSFGMWIVGALPFVVAIIFAAWFLLRSIYQVRGSIEVDCERIKLPYSPGVTFVLTTTLITVVGWLTSGYHGLSSGTVSLIPLILFFGTGILNTRDLRNLSWDVLLVMGGGLCLGAAMAESGLATWVVDQLPTGSIGLYGIMLLFGIVACAMSSVMSNTATANLILPIALGLSVAPITPVLIGIAFACSLAMPLPISTPPNAMAFSSGELKVYDLLKPGLILTVVGVALAFTAGYYWWGKIGFF